MGGVPAMIGGALSSAGGAIGGAAKSMVGAGADAAKTPPGLSADASSLTLPAKTAENSGIAADSRLATPGGELGPTTPMGKFFGGAKQSLSDTYVQPWRNAISDFKGTGQPSNNGAMQTFFNAPQTETPAMRLRRMQQQ